MYVTFSRPVLLSASACAHTHTHISTAQYELLLILLALRLFEHGILSRISATHLAMLIKALCSHPCANKTVAVLVYNKEFTLIRGRNSVSNSSSRKDSILNTLAKTSFIIFSSMFKEMEHGDVNFVCVCVCVCVRVHICMRFRV